jgi:cytochrome oxidase Cu insertion factor (SCO1/SenC/PrrC family)
MIPMTIVFSGAYLAAVRLPVRATEGEPAPGARAEVVGVAAVAADGDGDGGDRGGAAAPSRPAGWLDRLSPNYLLRTLLAIGALAILMVGAAPMAVAATNGTADPILTEAANGSPNVVDVPAAPFTLTDQNGRPVSLSSLRGRTVVLTFLDPVCTSDCPIIAQELKLTDQLLGAQAGRVDLVAVDNNPLDTSPAFTRAFDKQEGLDSLPNWTYLTGSLDQLHGVWNDYGLQTEVTPAGAMVAHSDILYIIDRSGHTREIFNSDPGSGSAAGTSSFSNLLVSELHHYTAA